LNPSAGNEASDKPTKTMKKSTTYTVVITNPATINRPNELMLDHQVERFIECRRESGFAIPQVIKTGLTLDEALAETGYTREELGL
jgi:hypothetical protein